MICFTKDTINAITIGNMGETSNLTMNFLGKTLLIQNTESPYTIILDAIYITGMVVEATNAGTIYFGVNISIAF